MFLRLSHPFSPTTALTLFAACDAFPRNAHWPAPHCLPRVDLPPHRTPLLQPGTYCPLRYTAPPRCTTARALSHPHAAPPPALHRSTPAPHLPPRIPRACLPCRWHHLRTHTSHHAPLYTARPALFAHCAHDAACYTRLSPFSWVLIPCHAATVYAPGGTRSAYLLGLPLPDRPSTLARQTSGDIWRMSNSAHRGQT